MFAFLKIVSATLFSFQYLSSMLLLFKVAHNQKKTVTIAKSFFKKFLMADTTIQEQLDPATIRSRSFISLCSATKCLWKLMGFTFVSNAYKGVGLHTTAETLLSKWWWKWKELFKQMLLLLLSPRTDICAVWDTKRLWERNLARVGHFRQQVQIKESSHWCQLRLQS